MITCSFRLVLLNFILVNALCHIFILALPVNLPSSPLQYQVEGALANASVTNLTNLTPHDSSFRDVIKTAQLIANSSTGKSRFFRVIDVLSVITGIQVQNQEKMYQVIMKMHETPCAKRCGDFTQCQLSQVSFNCYI